MRNLLCKNSDELIRYNRLKSFILEPTSKIDYLTDNEIFLIINNCEYFENLISVFLLIIPHLIWLSR